MSTHKLTEGERRSPFGTIGLQTYLVVEYTGLVL